MSPDTIGCTEAEQALLGSLLRLPARRVIDVAERLQVEDFVDPANRVLLGAAVAVAVQGQDPDPALVVGELRRRGLEQSLTAHQGAGAYALEVYLAAGVPAAVDGYVRVVLEHAYRRRVLETGVRLQQLAVGNELEDLHDHVDQEAAAMQAAWQRMQPLLRHRPVEAVA